MPVYIDNFNAPYRNMTMCHMVADTTEELIDMVNKIGVNKKNGYNVLEHIMSILTFV